MKVKIKNTGKDKVFDKIKDKPLYLGTEEEKELEVTEDQLEELKKDTDLVIDIEKRRIMD